MAPRNFLIIANGRTGSSWLLTSLDRLPDATARHELKWAEEGFTSDPDAHYVIDATSSVVRAIDDVTSGQRAPIRGSKLIFNPYSYYGNGVFNGLSHAIEPEIQLILLKRGYFETWLSWNVRGVHHKIDDDVATEGNNRMLAVMKRLPEPISQHLLIYHRDIPLSDYAGQAIPYPLPLAVDALLQYYANDMQALAMCQARAGLVVDYSQISGRLPEIAQFIGSQANDSQLSDIIQRPQTLKLPGLEHFLHPHSPLREIAAALDRCFADAAAGSIEPDKAFHWQSPTEITIATPYVVEAFVSAELASAGDNVVWSIQRPTIGG